MKLTKEALEKIHTYTLEPIQEEDIFAFEVRLCDNEIDRDEEQFSTDSLEKLKTLFVGKTGIFDHNPKGENQTARLYDTEIVRCPEQITSAGEAYQYLKGYAYMIRTEKNADLIREIQGGIKKEVSVSCSAKRRTCSICHKSACGHIPGERYHQKLCHFILEDITDAYEWSFVAIPAQREAGVTKNYATDPAFLHIQKKLQKQNLLLEKFHQLLREDIIRFQHLNTLSVEQGLIGKALDKMELDELLDYRELLRQKPRKSCPGQIPSQETDSFKIGGKNHAGRGN